MSPNPENQDASLTGEEIVISGISGNFPNAENTQTLIDNLYNKVDMIKTNKFVGIQHPELPQHYGKIDGLNKFDSQFFRFTHWQAASFDPVGRKNMEQAYSAIFDAGINPETLKGTKLGVFIGSSKSDTSTMSLYDIFKNNGFVISGCSKAMTANRISYWIDSKGPSYSLDNACASSMACLELAVERMKSGDCDSAIVGGCHYNSHPMVSLNMKRAGLLCLDGKTKCFDKNGDGYVRSDAINLMFLQKAKHAKRIYTQVYHIKGKQLSTPDALFLPLCNSDEIEKFLEEFYSEIDVSPQEVEYVEANAIGIAEADGKELEAIGNIFGKIKPIKVGSIKSNIGHTEPSSGMCSLTKICVSYQRGEIPANLHYNEPQNQIAAVREGKVQVVTEKTNFERSFTAVNNFSYTGANYHLLLKGHYKPKNTNKYMSAIPRLVLASGRQDQCVNKILNTLETNPIDPEQLALLNNIFKYNLPGHTGRGYTIIDTVKNKTVCLAKGFEFYSGNTRPVCFLYSGMGSQWPTMGTELMRLPVFAAAIERCDKVLQPKGLDIKQIITANEISIFDNILNCFVGITAIQIALTDVLRSIGISPDNVIGHSTGEMACAYADGSLTLEQIMLITYIRGKVSLETKFIKGKMAAIGLGHKEVRKICPPEIDIACQNSSQSTTISGPAEDVEKFVAYLTERCIFAKPVITSDIAFHSRYIADAGPSLISKIKDVIKNPKARSKLWLSTSYHPDQWSDECSLYSSPEYFTHNFLNTVLFDETAKMIPNDAIIIEIAPHGLMQAIMKRSHVNCLNLSLTQRGEKDNVKYLLKAVGTLYQAGLNPDIDALYPKIEFPVSSETSVLSHFVEWDHSVEWFKQDFNVAEKKNIFSYEFVMSIHDDEYSFCKEYYRNGINIFPEAAVLVIVWKTLAMFKKMNYKNTLVEFNNITFHDKVVIEPEKLLKLFVSLQRGTTAFEVTQNQNLIATGFITLEPSEKENFDDIEFIESDYNVNAKDIYKVMSLRGYTYEGKFNSIKFTNIERTKGLLKWENNWITFLDSLIQLNALSRNHSGVSNLKLITKLLIDVEAHKRMKNVTCNSDICYKAQIFYDNVVTICGGVKLLTLVFNDIPKEEHITENLHIRKFMPHSPECNVDLQTAMQVNLQIVSKSIPGKIVIYYQKCGLKQNLPIVIKKIVEDIPSLSIEITTVSHIDSIFDFSSAETKPDAFIVNDTFGNTKIEQRIGIDVDTKIFAVVISQNTTIDLPKNYNVITKFYISNQIMFLLEKTTSKTVTLDKENGGHYFIPVQVKSRLNNVKLINQMSNSSDKYAWVEVPFIQYQKSIEVVYSTVSLNDFKKSAVIGKNVNKNGFGYSGINTRGERVMGVVSDSSISSLIEANYDFLWPVPKHWNLEEAASAILPYIQAYYCLHIRETLRKRSNVFIMKGDSALGQAMISLCLNQQCVVFTTVKNIKNKTYLMKIFPELKENHIGFTDDYSFLNLVVIGTNNKRCDTVVNFGRGKMRQAAMDCTGFYGTLLDIGDHDMEENHKYGMSFNTEAKCYKSIRLSNIFLPVYSSESKRLRLMLGEGIASGTVKPLTRVIYSPDKVSKAFQLLASDNNTGNVLINMKDPSVLKSDYRILNRIKLFPSKSYVIVCDGTELGVQLIEKLIQSGAKRLLIHINSKLMNGYFNVNYASWKNHDDVIIKFDSGDLLTKSASDKLITNAEQLGGIDGIFITHNEDAEKPAIINQDNNDMSLITSNLDTASRNCTLNHFAILYYKSQVSKNLSFSDIEKCCFARGAIGLPSLILQYESTETKISPKALSKLFNALETGLKQNYTSLYFTDSTNSSENSTQETNIKDGIGALFKKISRDELKATEPLIFMKTQVNYGDESELYLHPEDVHLMVIPGFDGNYETMTSVSESLKIPAFALQLEPHLVTSIPDIAQRLFKVVRQRFHKKSKFYVLGYSFGVNVALELAVLLEKEGQTGVVFCLDSSPDALKDQLITYTGNMTDEQLQNSLIKHFYNLLNSESFEEIKEEALEWPEKVNIFIENIKSSVSYTHEYLKCLVHAAYRRIVMAKEYKPNIKLESELVLIKGIPHPDSVELANDYGLSVYSKKPVKIINIKADHVTAPLDSRISNIVNSMLDPELLADFEKKNLCDYYYG